jgi:enediyne polyketide synthase
MEDSGVSIVGMALEFAGASDPAGFHDLIVAGSRMFRPVPGTPVPAALLGGQSGDGEQELAERTAAKALTEIGAHAAGLRAGKLIAHDSACSLRAVAAACDAILRGEYDLVLAGGVSLGIDPARPESRAAPPDEVRPYDARPTGSLPGEGCGVVALMASAQARTLGLEAYAEIAGWYASGTADPARGILDAYREAGLTPGLIQYVEGHGAATDAGDQAELSLLLEIFSAEPGPPHGRALGAVSACIGDTRAAAGAAGLIKTALSMTSGIIPPSAGPARPHHLLEKEPGAFGLPGSAVPWPGDGPRLAAVNAMTSGPVHLILRREPEPERTSGRRRRAPAVALPDERNQPADLVPRPRIPTSPTPAGGHRAPVVPKPPVVVALHGMDRSDLASALDTITIMASRLSSTDLHEFAEQLAADVTGGLGPLRATILAEDPPQLAARARRAADLARRAPLGTTLADSGLYLSQNAKGRVVLVLAGLADTPLRHAELFTGCRATLDWLAKTGVTPTAVVGYGLGEIVALAWGGCLTPADAARLVAQRAEVLRAAPRHTAFVRVEASEDEAAELIEGTPLAVAAIEGPSQRLIKGPVAAIKEVMGHRRYVELGTETTTLGPAMYGAAAAVRFRPPVRRVISATTGREVRVDDDLVALVGEHLVAPARLDAALAAASSIADLIIAPAELADASPGPAVATPDPRVPASVAAAKAALFAAGAITTVT